jgi:hypothetical protein
MAAQANSVRLLEGLHVLDQRRRAGGGRLQRAVCHLVGDSPVDLVTQPREHG